MREPLLPAGTVLEFGLFGPDLLVIDAKPDLGSEVRLFTRGRRHSPLSNDGSVMCVGGLRYAMRLERRQARRLNLSWFAEPERRNDFFLLRESERAACDTAGDHWLKHCAPALWKERRLLVSRSDTRLAAPGGSVGSHGIQNAFMIGHSMQVQMTREHGGTHQRRFVPRIKASMPSSRSLLARIRSIAPDDEKPQATPPGN